MQGLAGGIIIALMNTLGAALVVVWPDPSDRALDGALGFAAGVMLSASFTSLILPGIEAASEPGYPALSVGGVELAGILPVLVGFAVGVLLLDRADQWVPHIHVVITGRGGVEADESSTDAASDADAADARSGGEARIETDTATGRERLDADDARTASVLLFIVAITLHNMPEGLAVGVGFGSGNLGDALALMLAIGVQNIPEGLAVSVAAANAGFGSLFYATLAGVRAGLVEIPLAVFGVLAVGVATPILPYAMGFAAGGMLFVISDEIVPETHARGHERIATLGTMLGVAVMLYLDIVLAG
ncbi:ZIP family metal transporter [Halorussus sp. MSC15.2]|uniref:ZIP family metal transporter n=1 Tax=Halorussus sp. MSC15.2 TaxID=2283638 RepID=UPI0013D16CC4|nr:ZIP family metal transporter [Halorussus sp. MSC15.2]NEU56050.1 ZIP family metal transporter [Halorussus sp. MSC15.2]